MFGWIKRKAPDSDSLVYEDDRFLINRIKSVEEAFYYGTKTKWCITKGNYNGGKGVDYSDYCLNRFIEFGARIFIIKDKLAKRLDPYSKIVLHIAPFPHTVEHFHQNALKNTKKA